jgi:hypothetical protein
MSLTTPIEAIIDIYDDDIFIVSYPRSGNTWVRFLLVSIIYELEKIDFKGVETYSRDLHDGYIDNSLLKNLKRPRLMKYHGSYWTEFDKHIDIANFIYVYRDVRDVIVSLYYYFIKMGGTFDFDTFFEGFVNYNVIEWLDGFKNPEKVGAWDTNIESWLDNQERIILVKYEDMISDSYTEIVKILKSLDLDITENQINKAIKNCTFNKMQETEETENNVTYLSRNRNIKFIRNGKVGQWKSMFKENHIETIKKKYGDLLIKLEYEKDLNW